MAEENKNTVTAETAAETDNNKAEKQPEAPPPSLADDFLKLEQLNLIRAVTIRMQGGRHPSREIEGLLQRRMNFPREELQGPYVVRMICTIMMVFVAATICWGILWAFSNILELSYFQRLVSTGIATLFAALAGVAIFHPSSIPDEKTLADAIEARMNELRKELGTSEQPSNDQAKTDKESQVKKANTKTQTSEQPVAPTGKAASQPDQTAPKDETSTASADEATEENIESSATGATTSEQAETTENEEQQS